MKIPKNIISHRFLCSSQLRSFLNFTPLIGSLFLLAIPQHHGALKPFLARFGTIILLFFVWQLTLLSAGKYGELLEEKKRSPALNYWLVAMLLSAISSLFVLTYIRISILLKFETPLFYLCFLLMGQIAIVRFLERKAQPVIASCARFFFDVGVVYLSFQMTYARWSWQILLYAIAFASALLAWRLSFYVGTTPAPLWTKNKWTKSKSSDAKFEKFLRLATLITNAPYSARAYGLALFAGPAILATLSLSGQLSPYYISLYLMLPLLGTLTQRARSLIPSDRNIFITENTGILLLFQLIILGSSLLYIGKG